MSFLQHVNNMLHRWNPTPLESEDYEITLLWMDSLSKPINYIDASYKQYLCQCYFLESSFLFIRDIICFFLFIVYLLRPNNKVVYSNQPSDIGFFGYNLSLPNEVKCKRIESFENFYLTYRERKEFLKDVFPFKKNYFFKLKLLVKIGMYNYYIQKYQPKIIYCSCEYSFTSSYLTLFCHRKNIAHYNIQHGDELPSIYCAFYSFDLMYYWHDRYIQYARRVRSNVKEYTIFSPNLLKKPSKDIPVIYDYKYYLQNQKEQTMEKIFLIMSKLQHVGYKVAVRMHPSYRVKYFERKYNDLIENPNKTIEESIYETKNGIASNSTVLMQLEEAGKGIVLDDLTNPVVYENLKKAGYHYLNEGRLSKIC